MPLPSNGGGEDAMAMDVDMTTNYCKIIFLYNVLFIKLKSISNIQYKSCLLMFIGLIKFMSDKSTDTCTLPTKMDTAELYKLYAKYSGIRQEQLVIVHNGEKIPRAGNYTLSDLSLVDGCKFQVSNTAGSSTVVASSSMFVPLPSGEELVVPSCPAGLLNHGNTCYLNSALQSLFHTPTFRNKLLSVRLNDIPQLSTFISTLQYPTKIGTTTGITPTNIA